jgi:hypothetical protein
MQISRRCPAPLPLFSRVSALSLSLSLSLLFLLSFFFLLFFTRARASPPPLVSMLNQLSVMRGVTRQSKRHAGE